jgi:hypothetical protein
MPLKHLGSKAAFKANLQAELAANRPKDQALAIAYSEQRKAKAQHMADGGVVRDPLKDLAMAESNAPEFRGLAAPNAEALSGMSTMTPIQQIQTAEMPKTYIPPEVDFNATKKEPAIDKNGLGSQFSATPQAPGLGMNNKFQADEDLAARMRALSQISGGK